MLIEDAGIPPGTFGNIRFLDSGFRGSRVYSAIDGGRVVAVKVVDLDGSYDELAEAEREVLMLCSLQHAHVARLVRSFVNGHFLLIVQRLYSSLSLYRLLEGGFPEGLPELAVAFVLRDCLIGLTYLHNCGLVHRALSSAHLLCDDKGRISITGMRHSIAIAQGVSHDFPSQHALHNLPWLAPEILAQDLRGYGRSSDIYSMGILALELANGKAPFAGLEAEKVLLYKLRDIVPSLNASKCFREPFTDFTDRCLQYEPENRPTCVELVRHVYLKQVKKYSSLWRFIHPPKDIKSIQEAKQSPMRLTAEGDKANLRDSDSLPNDVHWSWERSSPEPG